MGNKRNARISEEIKKIVSRLLIKGLKDPRISPMTSVTQVEVTRDHRYAKVYITVLGDEGEKENTLTAIKNAAGFVRKEIGNNMKLRYTPEPIFYLDDSIENGIRISKILNDLSKKDGNSSDE
ncbi:30S ribosome-binding factor RbfA [Clostridiisalibacter paucivorans]|uniref:30S ribosome-binding factor RbfA n=1 Tax=Clostridiisalibacter paucivorans TaxID=408753 RepID=UPI000479BDFD|nr:30S ribosome-binding factor RbfA [Clostridiisalibacter paucivorans]